MPPAQSLPAPPAPDDDIIDAEFEPEAREEEVRGEEVREEEVRSQKSEVSAEADAASPPLTSDLRALTSEPPEPPPAVSAAQWEDVAGSANVLREDKRQQILFDLATRGEANVGTLAGRARIEAAALSHHLTKLKDLDLLLCRRDGKEHWYRVNPARVRYQRDPAGGGGATLTLIGRATGIPLTITIPAPPGAAPPAAAMPPDL